MDPLAQIVHSRQMLLPQGIKHLQHDRLFKMPHHFGTCLLLLLLIRLDYLIEDPLAKRFLIQFVIAFQPAWNIKSDAVFLFQPIDKALNIPLLFKALRWDILVNHTINHILANGLDRLGNITLRHQFVTLLVDHLSLVVSNIIILEQIFANIEIVPFHLALGIFDGPRYPGMLYRLTALHTEFLHNHRNAIRGKDPHQVILEREIKAC